MRKVVRVSAGHGQARDTTSSTPYRNYYYPVPKSFADTVCMLSPLFPFRRVPAFSLRQRKRAQVAGLVRSARYGAHVGHGWFDACGGTLRAVRAIARDEGAAALYKGLVPTLLKVAPAAGVTFVVYEWCKAELLSRGWHAAADTPTGASTQQDLPGRSRK